MSAHGGIGATGIKAGLIKCATGEGSIKPYEEGLLRAASRAQKATGVPIITHTDHGSLGDKQLEIFFSEGVKPDQIIEKLLAAVPVPKSGM